MSFVRFATICDVRTAGPGTPCNARSTEYTAHPHCRGCGDHVCPAHVRPGSEVDRDEHGVSVLCIHCDPADDVVGAEAVAPPRLSFASAT